MKEYIVRIFNNYDPLIDKRSSMIYQYPTVVLTDAKDGGAYLKTFTDYELMKLELQVLRYKYPKTTFKVHIETTSCHEVMV